MAKYNIQWTGFAIESLEQIESHITKEAKSKRPATKLINKIFKEVDLLQTNPLSFQEEPYLKEKGMSARYLIIGMYKVIYIITDSTVNITDVFNCSQHQSKINS